MGIWTVYLRRTVGQSTTVTVEARNEDEALAAGAQAGELLGDVHWFSLDGDGCINAEAAECETCAEGEEGMGDVAD